MGSTQHKEQNELPLPEHQWAQIVQFKLSSDNRSNKTMANNQYNIIGLVETNTEWELDGKRPH